MSYLSLFQMELMATSKSPAQLGSDRSRQKMAQERESRLYWERLQGSKGRGKPAAKRPKT